MRLPTLLLLTLLLLPLAAAEAGINLPGLQERTIYFEPGASYEWTWSIFGSEHLDVSLSGQLTEYAELVDPAPGSGPRSVTFRLNLPEELEPGRYVFYLSVVEDAPGGMIGGRAGARGGIVIISLHPTPFLLAKLSVPDTSEGADTDATLTLESWSLADFSASANIRLLNSGGEQVLETTSPQKLILSRAKTPIITPLPTSTLEPGTYTAIAEVQGGQPGLEAETTFRIGQLDLSLTGYTQNMTIGRINEFEFRLKSNWNNEIQGLYGIVTLLGAEGTSPTTSIPRFGKGTFTTFLDFTDAGEETLGEHEGLLTVFYNDDTGEQRSKEFPITVNLVEERTPSAASSLSEKLVVIFSTPIILYLLLLLLILLNIAYFLYQKRRQ